MSKVAAIFGSVLAIDRVGARMGAQLSGRVALSFEPAQRGPCALRGLTLSHQRIIQLYYAPETPEQRVLAIVAGTLVARHLRVRKNAILQIESADRIMTRKRGTVGCAHHAED